MTPEKDIFSSKEGRWDFAIAIIVIALFSIFIYLYIFTKEDKIADSTIELETTEESPLPTSYHAKERTYVYSSSDIYVPVTIPAKDAIDPNKIIAVVISDTTITEADFENDKLDSIIEKETFKKQPSLSTSESQEIMLDSVVENNGSTVIEETVISKKEVPTKISDKAIVSSPETKFECMAMVGVFKNENNISAIVKRLKDLGYTHTQGSYPKGLTYVSVPVDCANESKKKELISELNKAFGIDSYVKKR